jgi:EmrB/QacA subfamily drug resistance transporter
VVPTDEPERRDPDRIDRGTAVALVAMVLAVFVVANDFTALSVALPTIEADFDSNVGTVEWVINAYALVFGVFIITGGRLADLFGRRRMFVVGAVLFAVPSLLAGLAQDIGLLIGWRALMGIGGALMWPATLGMTYSLLPASRAGLAGGLVIGAAGLGNATGPLLGGVLTDELSWRWVFFLNLPVAAIATVAVLRTIAESRGEDEERRIDYAGIATLSLGLLALLLALDLGPDNGWDAPEVLVPIVAAPLLLGLFALAERRAGAAALLPPDVLSSGQFRAVCAAVLLMSPSFFAVLMYVPQYMQKLLDFSALGAGLGFLPLMATFACVSFAAGPLYDRVGGKPVVVSGAALICAGMLLLSLAGGDSSYPILVPGMVAMGAGVGLFYSSVTTVAVTAVRSARASLAGAIVYMFQIAGGALGLGLTTAIFSGVSSHRLEADAASQGIAASPSDLHAVHGVLAGTESSQQVLASFPADVARELVELAGDAFAAGMQWALRVDGALAFASLLVTLAFVGGRLELRRRSRSTAETAETAETA